MEFKLRADYLMAASHCRSTEVERPYLKGVHVERHPSGQGVLMVATNGQICAVLYDPDGYADRKAIISLPWKTAELATKPRSDASHCILNIESLDAGVGKILCDGEPVDVVLVNEIPGTYPDWRRVMPSDCSKDYPWQAKGFAMGLLATIHKAIKIVDPNSNPALDIIVGQTDGQTDGPAIVHSKCQNAVFVIMPRCDVASGKYTPPAWLGSHDGQAAKGL